MVLNYPCHRLISILSVLVLTTSVAAAQSPPTFRTLLTQACGQDLIGNNQRDARNMDSADTAGDNDTVISLARAMIVRSNNCLNNLAPSSPSALRVYLRNQLLGATAFMMNAFAAEQKVSEGEQAMRTEARIATEQCDEPDILSPEEPFASARTFINGALDRAKRVLAYRNTPLDDYKAAWRTCAAKLGASVTF